jgi:outer membrane lipoprotein-sorting protein
VKSATVSYCLSCILFAVVANAATPSPLPPTAPAGVDPAMWERMKLIDHAAAQIADLTADFKQEKQTALLKNPMVSTGSVWARGSEMLWNTRAPQPTIMHVDERQITLYYPDQKTAEIYPVSGPLAQLTASPVPRLADLLQHFSFAAGSSTDLGIDPHPDQEAFLLTPTDKDISDHVENVVVLIDAKAGFILAFKLTDSDGETTLLRFSNVKINTHFDDKSLRLDLPADVKTVHPLESAGPQP